MRRPLLIHLGVQILTLLVACMCAGSLALPLAGMIGGLSAVTAPDELFELVEPMVCPDGSQLEYELNQRSYNQPGEYQLDLFCVSPDGGRQNAVAEGLLGMLGLSFVVAFLPVLLVTYLILGAAAFFIVRWFLNRSREKSGTSALG